MSGFNKKWWVPGITIILFIIFSPLIDQYLAAATYSYTTKTFYGEHALWCKVIYYMVPVITVFLILTPLGWLYWFRHDRQKFKPFARLTLMMYIALSLGPGIIVNVVFKEHWGRPRPYQVLRDGKQYSPFWVPHLAAHKDNSFPGGHASIGFFLGIPYLFLGKKKHAIIISLAGGVMVGGVRILQGGHYFSDIVFAGVFVWLSAKAVLNLEEKVRSGE